MAKDLSEKLSELQVIGGEPCIHNNSRLVRSERYKNSIIYFYQCNSCGIDYREEKQTSV